VTTPKLDELRAWGVLKPGAPVKDFGPLFPRVEKEAASPGVPTAPKSANVVELLDYDHFAKLDLRSAKIINAAKVEGADKLLKLEVLIGEERRQIVAGIALYYTPEQVIGKTVVIVANLKPAKIRGVESQGMLLAASKGEKLVLVTLDGELSSGAKVK
jgi:methionyl-tRNA synthetase